MKRSFYLALGDDDFAEIYRTEGAAIGLAGARESAREIHLCIPDHRGGFTAENVTDRLAELWWKEDVDARDMQGGFVPPDLKTVPLAFRGILATEVAGLSTKEHSAETLVDDSARQTVEAA